MSIVPVEAPQILLLGNGLNLQFEKLSWDKLLENISEQRLYPDGYFDGFPEPLKAILLSNDHIDAKLRERKDQLFGKVESGTQLDQLQDILSIGFDQILTTNYSYELEIASLSSKNITEKDLKNMSSHTPYVSRVEPKYLLHSYNYCTHEGKPNQVWHIHGEARKPDSMILGHYYYGELFYRIRDFLHKRKDTYKINQQNEKPTFLHSWVDGFILGDLYILGFGFALTEFDLWWLLNRRKHEKAKTGKIFFYEAKPAMQNAAKQELLQLMGVTLVDCGMQMCPNGEKFNYTEFYRRALNDIRQKVTEARESANCVKICD